MADAEKKETDSSNERVDGLKVKVNQLESLVASREQEVASRDGRISGLEKDITERDNQIASLKQSLAESEDKLKQLEGNLAQAVISYRAALISANPDIPEELIDGETIEAIEESLAKAKKLVGRVRQGLEAEAMQSRFPGGAPPRTAPDLSALSPKEKIQYAIGGAAP